MELGERSQSKTTSRCEVRGCRTDTDAAGNGSRCTREDKAGVAWCAVGRQLAVGVGSKIKGLDLRREGLSGARVLFGVGLGGKRRT